MHTAVRNRRRIQCGIDGNPRIPVQVRPSILVPYEIRAFVRRFIHKHRAKTGDRGTVTVNFRADLAENRFLKIRQKIGIEFQILDFPIQQRRALMPSRLRSRRILARFPVQLHHDFVIIQWCFAEHNVVHVLLQVGEFGIAGNLSDANVAVLPKVFPLCISDMLFHECLRIKHGEVLHVYQTKICYL